jgi:hypothetical protein
VQHNGAHSRTAELLALLKQLKVGSPGTNHAVYGHMKLGITGPKQVESTNSSGYADDDSAGDFYTEVSGSWTEPTATRTSTTSMAAFWVGIDGFDTNTVEQDGTLIVCSGGSPTYYTWWEMPAKEEIQTVGSTVKPGDHISASVIKRGTRYIMELTDSTTAGNSFIHKASCAVTEIPLTAQGSSSSACGAPSSAAGHRTFHV